MKLVIKRLRTVVVLWRISPLESVFQQVDSARDHQLIINTRHTVREWEKTLDLRNLAKGNSKGLTE